MTAAAGNWASDLAPALVEALVNQGYGVFCQALPQSLWQALAAELAELDQQGALQLAGIGRADLQRVLPTIRSDQTCWLDGSSDAQQVLLAGLESLREAINRELFLGLHELEALFAVYRDGAFYRRHLDAFGRDNLRQVSVVIYLNPDWQSQQGGQLRLWATPDASDVVVEVEPQAGTLVCFLSEQIPHEVMPVTGTRYSIAGWFRRRP